MSVIPDAAFAQSGLTEVPAGRVALLEPEPSLTGDIASIRVLDDPAFGNLTVNPDMTLALVLSDTKDTGDITMRYAVTFDDGREEIVEKQLTVTEAPLENGWALGDNLYDLRTDADGKTILETGDNHYKVHVSGSEDALTKADIAALEGISVSQVNGAYLASSDYGSTPELALAPDAMRELWWHTTVGSGPSSSWMLIERGYEYELDDLAGLVYRKSVGENEFNPIVVTAYGEGEDPVIQGAPRLYGGLQKNIVISDLHLADGLVVLDAENVLVENVSVTGGEVVIQTTDGVTIKDSAIYDADPTPPPDGNWAAHADREQGLFMARNEDVLIENTLFDDNGWEEGGAPPSMFSHNVYIQHNNPDLTFRDNISMQGSSFGGNIRPGGFFEDNIFLDNNAALGIASGDPGSNLGNYNLLNGNVVTSGAHKGGELIGALAWGIDNNGIMTTMHDNIVAHLANPDDPSELDYKEIGADGVKGPRDAWYDDTVVYNWTSAKDIREGNDRDVNTENVDPAVADVTTIQRYTAELLGQETATIEDLSDYLRANFGETTNGMTNADLIAAYFREGFGIEVDLDTTPGAARFVPDGLADGMRWDNRMNWQDDALPEDGDNVDLAGNWVYYNGTHEIGALDMGEGGKLHVTSGYLEVDGPLSSDDGQASEINISHVGQFFTNDYEDLGPLEINVDGGRFANIGAFYGQVDLEITDGQTLLAMEDAHFAAAGGSRVSIQGSDAKVGFDGAAGGPAVLGLSANMALEYVADADGFSSISEFHSGQFENEGTNVESAIDLGNVTLRIDATAWAGALQSHLLMRADEIVGEIGTVDVIGLGAGVDARIVVDYQNDTVFLETFAGANGTSDVSIQTFGGPGDFGGSDTLLTALQSPLPGWPEPPAPAPAPATGAGARGRGPCCRGARRRGTCRRGARVRRAGAGTRAARSERGRRHTRYAGRPERS